ncbi:serine/threonine-protein kinase ATM-like [Gossypium australe]|uniref:Serine/threonine-protein kinase ATM-like n=1 Tax=Gossypium australe TaxID=47621 RepID=A0A5B6WAE1_9ROSI|nr:serine/threonine-protein kinase ATM-like [Gossypium australe]
MENPKTPETLEAKGPDLDLLEEAYEPPDLLTLIESSNGLGSILDVQLQENGNAFGGDSLAMDVKENGVNIIETEEGCLVGDGVDNVKEDQEERLELRVDTGIGDNAVVEPIKDEGTKEDDRSGINGVGLVKSVQVSGDNISLYVDFSGTLNEVNSTGLMTVKEELMVDGQEYKFCVGDFVWIRTKSQSWWPGKIFDPSKVPEYALAGEKKNWLLVGYFGSSRVAWCCSSQLKPFHVNFRQMIGRNKARSFLGAVEKAVEDFGKCLKMEMTCSCMLKEDKFLSYGSSTKEGASMPERKSGRLGEFSATQFEPVKFLCQLKSFAQVVSKPDMLEFVALQNYLSAFYCSIGHCQLPLHQLWATTYDADNAGSGSMGERDNNAGLAEGNSISYKFLLEQSDVMKNEMLQHNPNGVTVKTSGENWGALPESCEDIIAGEGVFSSKQALTSRKRKRKVHYELSSSSTPFEGPDQGTCLSVENGDDDSELRNETGYELRGTKEEQVKEFIGSPSSDKRSAKRFQKTWYRKFIKGNDVTAYPELSNTSSADLLSELHLLAVDCLFQTESKTFGLTEWFFSRFRISSYHDESIYEMHCKNMANQKEATVTDPCLLGNDPHQTKPTSSPLTSPRNKMQKKKQLTNSATSNAKSPSGMLDGNINLVACNLSAKESQAMASEAPNGKQTHQDTKEATNIPDLNGNGAINPGLFVANEDNASSRSFMLDFQGTGPHSVETIAEQSNREGLNVSLPDSSGPIAPLTSPNMVSFPSKSKSGQKKRGRKPRAPSSSTNPVLTSNIPDLNGTSTEPNTSTKDSQEANSVPPTGKPARKRRRRRKGEISLGTPSMIINYNGAGTSGKLLATTLLLTFTPGASMPSKEVLVATFSRFGPLKESEVQILKDSSNARVVFMRNEDAAKALRSLEESNPFGATLTNYQLQNNNILTTHQHMEGFRLPAKLTGAMPCLGDAPPIDVIKKNLEMMTSMLEKSGDNLSPEMKAKLESEIKGLLKKVSHCPGSSS